MLKKIRRPKGLDKLGDIVVKPTFTTVPVYSYAVVLADNVHTACRKMGYNKLQTGRTVGQFTEGTRVHRAIHTVPDLGSGIDRRQMIGRSFCMMWRGSTSTASNHRPVSSLNAEGVLTKVSQVHAARSQRWKLCFKGEAAPAPPLLLAVLFLTRRRHPGRNVRQPPACPDTSATGVDAGPVRLPSFSGTGVTTAATVPGATCCRRTATGRVLVSTFVHPA